MSPATVPRTTVPAAVSGWRLLLVGLHEVEHFLEQLAGHDKPGEEVLLPLVALPDDLEGLLTRAQDRRGGHSALGEKLAGEVERPGLVQLDECGPE